MFEASGFGRLHLERVLARLEKRRGWEEITKRRMKISKRENGDKEMAKKGRRSLRALILWPALFLVLMVAVGSATYYYYQYRSVLSQKNLSEVDLLMNRLSQMMELPDEAPTLATVTDKNKLADQPFFQKAQNGDKVLIFPQAKKALLYRPETKKIIDVVPVRTVENQATPTARLTKQEPLSAVLYNGTTVFGLTFKVEGMLAGRFPFLQVQDRQMAGRTDYGKTLVVDLAGDDAERAQEIARFLGADLGELPEGEVKPNADILIIVGGDQV
jgi:hypothetical protein